MRFLRFIFDRFVRPPAPVAELCDVMLPETPKAVQIDKRIQSIKAIAAMRLSRKRVPVEMADGLSGRTKDWLLTLNIEMLLLVSSGSYSQLREHLAGRKTIRGLLAADPASVAAYKEALRPKISLSDIDGRRGGGGPKRASGGPKMGQ